MTLLNNHQKQCITRALKLYIQNEQELLFKAIKKNRKNDTDYYLDSIGRYSDILKVIEDSVIVKVN